MVGSFPSLRTLANIWNLQMIAKLFLCILGMSNIVYARSAVDVKPKRYRDALIGSEPSRSPDWHFVLAGAPRDLPQPRRRTSRRVGAITFFYIHAALTRRNMVCASLVASQQTLMLACGDLQCTPDGFGNPQIGIDGMICNGNECPALSSDSPFWRCQNERVL